MLPELAREWSIPMHCVLQLDPRYTRVTDLIRNGEFGWDDFFEPMVTSITSGSDYYLLANDFPSYIEAQVPLSFCLLCLLPLSFQAQGFLS